MKIKIVKLSICKCGFTLLNENVQLGTEYEINESDVCPGAVKCGGCGAIIPAQHVWTYARGGGHSGYLPREIFGL